jgi:rhamnosyltransferase
VSQEEQIQYSVIIPTRNGGRVLREFFSALRLQTLQPTAVIVGDSMSDDDTVDICRENGATVYPIDLHAFDHGGTRSLLTKKAPTEIVVFFTQDAILADREAVSRLLVPLAGDRTLSCCYGRQLPRIDANPISAHLRLFNYPERADVRTFADRNRLGIRTIFISNSFAAYRKSDLAAAGYFKNGLIFGEDTCTLGRLLQAGGKVMYVADAQVYHSHNYSWLEEFRRSFDIGVLHQSEKWLLATYGLAENVGARYVRELFASLWQQGKYGWMLDAAVRSAGKFAGYKLGRNFDKIPIIVRPTLSMHRRWWQGEGGGKYAATTTENGDGD